MEYYHNPGKALEIEVAGERYLRHGIRTHFVEVGEESTRYRAPIRLTEKGYAAMAEVNGLISQIVRQAGGGLLDEQRRALYASLESVLGQLRVIAR